jgi:hypothetical protein
MQSHYRLLTLAHISSLAERIFEAIQSGPEPVSKTRRKDDGNRTIDSDNVRSRHPTSEDDSNFTVKTTRKQ